MKLASYILALLLAAFSNQIGAETKFIKYKNYLIPVNSDKSINVYYIDDVDDSRQDGIDADPNGVLELPILIGWKKIGYYNLVGIGADGSDGFSFNTSFTQNLLSQMGETGINVLTGEALRDSIISKALALGSPNNRLVVAIGGPREIVLEAIQHANSAGTPIDRLIRVVGIQPCKQNDPVTNCKNPSVGPLIQSAIGQENYYVIPDSTTQAPTFRWFYLSTAFSHVGNRDSWYKEHYHQTKVGRFFRDNVSNNSTLEQEVMSINGGRLLRIADFTALAYIIWGDDIWSDQFKTRMYTEIASGIAMLPK